MLLIKISSQTQKLWGFCISWKNSLCLSRTLPLRFDKTALVLVLKLSLLNWSQWSSLNMERVLGTPMRVFWKCKRGQRPNIAILATWELRLIPQVPKGVFKNQLNILNLELSTSGKFIKNFEIFLNCQIYSIVLISNVTYLIRLSLFACFKITYAYWVKEGAGKYYEKNTLKSSFRPIFWLWLLCKFWIGLLKNPVKGGVLEA